MWEMKWSRLICTSKPQDIKWGIRQRVGARNAHRTCVLVKWLWPLPIKYLSDFKTTVRGQHSCPDSVGGDMGSQAVIALLSNFALFFAEGSEPFDCNNPKDSYTCDGGRYYRVLRNCLWKGAQGICEREGTQLAIAYSTQDMESMKWIMDSRGRGG